MDGPLPQYPFRLVSQGMTEYLQTPFVQLALTQGRSLSSSNVYAGMIALTIGS